MNCVGKLFAAVLYKRISEWAEDNHLLPEDQFGFRQGRRAIDCVFILNTAIENARKNRIPLYVCYVDFQKAFDNVKHDLLWGKLAELGLSRKMLVILQSMYSTATSRLKVSATKCTESFPSEIGVRQGCVLVHCYLTSLQVNFQLCWPKIKLEFGWMVCVLTY